jgi:hypothetical protein
MVPVPHPTSRSRVYVRAAVLLKVPPAALGQPHHAIQSPSERALILGNPHGASHLHPGLSCSSGAGDHDGFGSTTGALGTHRRVIGRHPFEGAAAVGGLYRHETRPVFERAFALGTQQVDTDSFPPRWACHASPFALLHDTPSLWHVRSLFTSFRELYF